MINFCCSPCPFTRLISPIWHPDVLLYCSSHGGALLFRSLRGQGGHCCSTQHVASQEVFCIIVWGREDWLAVGGLNPAEREVVAAVVRHFYLPPSLPSFSRDSLQLLGVCIIMYEIRPHRFPHNSFDTTCNYTHNIQNFLLYRISNLWTTAYNNWCIISFFIHFYPTSSSLPFHHCYFTLSLSCALFWSRADRNRKTLNFPREPPIDFLLFFLSSSISNGIYSY